MNKNAWSDDERAEFDALVDEALGRPAMADRVDVFLAGLDAAGEQARRYWAADCLNDMRRRGAEKILKHEQEVRRPRVPVADNGSVLGRAPREFGRTVRDVDGKVSHQRELFDFLTWDELRDRRDQFAKNARALQVDMFTVDKLLALEQRADAAATPDEACRILGTTVEAYLADEVA